MNKDLEIKAIKYSKRGKLLSKITLIVVCYSLSVLIILVVRLIQLLLSLIYGTDYHPPSIIYSSIGACIVIIITAFAIGIDEIIPNVLYHFFKVRPTKEESSEFIEKRKKELEAEISFLEKNKSKFRREYEQYCKEVKEINEISPVDFIAITNEKTVVAFNRKTGDSLELPGFTTEQVKKMQKKTN